jgi:hypothetical protein
VLFSGAGSFVPTGAEGGRQATSDALANVGIIFSSPATGLVYKARQTVGSLPSPQFYDHGLGDSEHLLDLFVPLTPRRRVTRDVAAIPSPSDSSISESYC